MQPLNEFKRKYLLHNAQVGAFSQSWPIWKPSINQYFLPPMSGRKFFDLGDNLREIFRKNKQAVTSQHSRSQSALTSGGTAWECLLVWYLNLLFWGTPVVAVRMNKNFVPKEIVNCLTVSIGNHKTNSESDILIFSVPDSAKLEKPTLTSLSEHISTRIGKVVLLLLQCKTNWNDNSQIPMLWNLIYQSHGFHISDVKLGRDGYSPESLKKFYYGFAATPSNDLEKFKSDSLSVIRVRHLTGGNYWGHKTTPNIASNIRELPGSYFSSHFRGGVMNHLNKILRENPAEIEDFINQNW